MNYFQECVKEVEGPLPEFSNAAIRPERIREVLQRLEGAPDARLVMALAFKIEMLRQATTELTTKLIQSNSLYKEEFWNKVYMKELDDIFSKS